MSRLSTDEYFVNLVRHVALRGTCLRRMTGCILVDSNNHILSTGYNGPPRGFDSCVDTPCKGASYKSGEGLDLCEAVHAEQNALLQCPDTNRIMTAYCTTAPCIHCVKLLLNTSCQRIVFIEDYPHEQSKQLWTRKGQWVQVKRD